LKKTKGVLGLLWKKKPKRPGEAGNKTAPKGGSCVEILHKFYGEGNTIGGNKTDGGGNCLGGENKPRAGWETGKDPLSRSERPSPIGNRRNEQNGTQFERKKKKGEKGAPNGVENTRFHRGRKRTRNQGELTKTQCAGEGKLKKGNRKKKNGAKKGGKS